MGHYQLMTNIEQQLRKHVYLFYYCLIMAILARIYSMGFVTFCIYNNAFILFYRCQCMNRETQMILATCWWWRLPLNTSWIAAAPPWSTARRSRSKTNGVRLSTTPDDIVQWRIGGIKVSNVNFKTSFTLSTDHTIIVALLSVLLPGGASLVIKPYVFSLELVSYIVISKYYDLVSLDGDLLHLI